MGEVILRPREHVLNEEKKQQAIALGRLGCSLRQNQKAIGVRRETISVYLTAAGIAMRVPRGQCIPAKPARQEDGVITDPAEAKTGQPRRGDHRLWRRIRPGDRGET
jgi:hypothetical protein